MDFRAADAAYSQALDAVDAAQDELSQAEYEYQQASKSGNTAALSAIQSRIDAAQSKLSSANAAADSAEANYTAAKAENDRKQQSQEAKATPTAADKVKEDVTTGQKDPQENVTAEDQENIATAEKESEEAIPEDQGTGTEKEEPATETNGTGTGTSTTQEVTTLPTVTVTAKRIAEPYVPPKNVLHNFVNGTYLISLHLLEKNAFNQLADSRRLGSKKLEFNPSNVLIASAGRYPTGQGRNPAWSENFFIENLDMTTMMGLTSTTQGSNAVQIKFNIIEPMGCTLIERLVKSSKESNYATYLEMAYALSIEFIGYDEYGNIKTLPNHRKYVPIKLAGISFKVSERGTEYAVTAVPYNHVAFNALHATMPVTTTITANTVNDYFSDVAQNNAYKKALAERESQEAMALTFDKATTNTPLASSWVAGVNKYEKDKEKKITTDGGDKKYIADVYQVVFADEIGNSKLSETLSNKLAEITKSPMMTEAKRLEQAFGGGMTLDSTDNSVKLKPNEIVYNAVTYTVNAGTSLVSEINRIVRNSEFLINQLKDIGDPLSLAALDKDKLREKAEAANKVLKWWRIIPHIKLLEFDYTRNCYAKEIIYEVIPYEVYSSAMPDTPSKAIPPELIRKEYNYIFTGKNLDIISFNLDFNTTYYMARTASPAKKNVTGTSPESNAQGQPDKQATNQVTSQDNLLNPQQRYLAGNNQSTAGAEANRGHMAQVTGDLQTHLFSRPSGDMVQINLDIIGDPDFIKQDDIFSGTVSTPNALNGSMPMDTSEVYIRINFKTPTDRDEDTGLINSTTQSIFSGIYKVLSVENQFMGGKFTQKLLVNRLFNKAQQEDTGKAEEAGKDTTAEKTLQLAVTDNTGDASVAEQYQSATPAVTTDSTESAPEPATSGNSEEEQSTAEQTENDKLEAVAEQAETKSIDAPAEAPPVQSTPPAVSKPTTVAVTPENTSKIDDGVYQFKDPLGKSQVVPVNTQEGVDAIAAATKTGEFAVYVDKDPNLGWVKVAYNPATGTRSIQEEYGDTPPQSKK